MIGPRAARRAHRACARSIESALNHRRSDDDAGYLAAAPGGGGDRPWVVDDCC